MNNIEVVQRDGWALVRLQRPSKRNAFDAAMRAEFIDAISGLRGCRVIVIVGSDSSFCAGLDLKESAADERSGRSGRASQEWSALIMAIHQHPAIFIAAVNGTALGGGVTLINVCELALACRSASIGCPEIGFARYPALAGPTTQLRVPPKAAAWMILTGKRIDAETAERWGLVNMVVPDELLEASAIELACHIAKYDATALAASKAALKHIPFRLADLEQAMAYGVDVYKAIDKASPS